MMEQIGRAHPTVRRLRALRRDAAERKRSAVFLAEGIHLAEEALGCGAEIELAVVSPRLSLHAEGRTLLDRLQRGRVSTVSTADTVLESLQDVRAPQPVLLVVRRRAIEPAAVVESRDTPQLVVVANALQDPGNLGAVLRTADAADATGLLATGDSTDLYHPRAVRGSMGSIFRLPAVSAALEQTLELLAAEGIGTVAADPAAEQDHLAFDFTRPTALFLGREGSGLDESLVRRLDHRVRIPMRQGVESLSVGAAAAVLLFEAARQRRG